MLTGKVKNIKRMLAVFMVILCAWGTFAHADSAYIYDVTQLISRVQAAERRYDSGLTVKMDAALYDRYTKEQWQQYIMDAATLVYSYSISTTRWSDEVQLDITFTQYREGAKMYRAWYDSELSSLTGEQRQALSIVMSKVMEIRQQYASQYDQALAVHDYLCERITYDNTSGPRVRTVVGALLDGRANCQGYTDSFYLMCSMLGMEVYCQNGMADGGGHTWNLLKINDQGWSIVDVTWDDGCRFMNGAEPNYIYFGIGSEQIRLTHQWDALCEPEGLVYFTSEDYFYYKGRAWQGSAYGRDFGSAAEAAQYCLQRAGSGMIDSYIMLWGAGDAGSSQLSDALKQYAQQRNIGCGWKISSMTRGGNAYLLVRITGYEE